MIRELVDYNLRRGSASLRSDVRHLLCLMSNNNASATDELIDMLMSHVVSAVSGHLSNPDFVSLFLIHLVLLFVLHSYLALLNHSLTHLCNKTIFRGKHFNDQS